MESQDQKKVDYLAIITLVAILIYGVGSLIGVGLGKMEYKEFSSSFAPIVSLLVGYWIRGTS